jgi:hypothetical protein
MIGSRPVLADFGIVHFPNKDRITEKPAGNRFAPFIPARYDPSIAPKVIDCFGIACLWGWLLADDKSNGAGPYHWRFHSFVDDERCEVVRAVMAICSDPEQSPANAANLLTLVETFFRVKEISLSTEDNTLTESISALSLAKAEQAMLNIKLDEAIDSTALALAVQIEILFRSLEAVCERLQAALLPIHYSGPKQGIPHLALSIAKAVKTSRRNKTQWTIASACSNDESLASFAINIFSVWHFNPHESGSLYSLGVKFSHDLSPEVEQLRSAWFEVMPNGTTPELDIQQWVRYIEEFLAFPPIWTSRDAPLQLLIPGIL